MNLKTILIMKTRYKILLIILVTFSAYVISVEIDNYFNGSFHETSIDGISSWTEISKGMGLNFDKCIDTPGSHVTMSNQQPICHMPDGTSYFIDD